VRSPTADLYRVNLLGGLGTDGVRRTGIGRNDLNLDSDLTKLQADSRFKLVAINVEFILRPSKHMEGDLQG